MSRRDEILADVDHETSPEKMSQQEALDWLEELAASIDARVDGLMEDLRRDSR